MEVSQFYSPNISGGPYNITPTKSEYNCCDSNNTTEADKASIRLLPQSNNKTLFLLTIEDKFDIIINYGDNTRGGEMRCLTEFFWSSPTALE